MTLNKFILMLLAILGSSSIISACESKVETKRPTITIIKDTSKVIGIKIKKGTKEVVLPLTTALAQAGLAYVLGAPAITGMVNLTKYFLPNDKSNKAGDFCHKEFAKAASIATGVGLVLVYTLISDTWTLLEDIESEASKKR